MTNGELSTTEPHGDRSIGVSGRALFGLVGRATHGSGHFTFFSFIRSRAIKKKNKKYVLTSLKSKKDSLLFVRQIFLSI